LLQILQENWQDCPYPARLLGVDQGEKTLGLSVCDAQQSVATPLDVIQRAQKKGKFAKDREALEKIVNDYDIKGLIFGYPMTTDGQDGGRCQSVRDTITALQQHAPFDHLWFGLWDERFSTSVMDRFLIKEADVNRKRRSEVIDKMAAQHILRGALDFLEQRRK
jgi:putative Holliday junction resolvase